MVKTLRDLLPGEPHPDEEFATFQAALSPTEWVAHLDPTDLFTARLPGDDVEDHPLAHTGENPFPGMGLQALLRLIKEGSLDMATDRKVRAHISQQLRLLGDGEFLRGGHGPAIDPEQRFADADSSFGGFRRADKNYR